MPLIDNQLVEVDLHLSIRSAEDVGKELLDDISKSDVSGDLTWKKVEEIAAKPSSKKKVFLDFKDVGAYHERTGRWPVVRKVKAKSGDPKDDTFELIKGFKDLAEARAFISAPDGFRSTDPEVEKRLSYLLWYLPEEYM
jgi:hypothetical protein